MRYLSAIAAIILSLGALPACSPAQQSTVLVHSSEDDIRQKIEGNWNVDVSALEACGAPVELLIHLSHDGSGKVTGVEILPGMPATDSCRRVAESARRAVFISSPLPLPADSGLSRIKFRFYPQ